MRLIVAHQILIGSAIALAMLFAVRSAYLYGRARDAGDLALAAVAVVVAIGLTAYLRRVREKWAAKRG